MIFSSALGFIIEFVRQLHASNANDRMSRVCRHAYDQTLAIHHPWLVRKGVHLAVYMLPNRNQVLFRFILYIICE